MEWGDVTPLRTETIRLLEGDLFVQVLNAHGLQTDNPRHPTRHFAEGEPVMFLRNDYRRDLRNGSLGRVVGVDGDTLRVEFDGITHDLGGFALEDLALAYAVTVHKAQGSSFRRVVIPVQRTRLLDRSLVYTAITRATDLAVLVGDPSVLREALEREAHADRRETALCRLIDLAYDSDR